MNTLPGAEPFSNELKQRFSMKYKNVSGSYKPRTRHLTASGEAKYTNRLFLENSPYLLQHAHNPVNWYPWSDEAFRLAKERNLPVLLSIGYSTCHWCHVMEEESFEDEEIAAYLNKNYIAVKVDREERPDIDAIYMQAVKSFTGSGGWPSTLWLLPDRSPFYAGTYFPARDGDRGSRFGFLTILHKLKGFYTDQGDKVRSQANNLKNLIQESLSSVETASDLPPISLLDSAFRIISSNYDDVFGGLRGSPKFPSSLPVRFLLRYSKRTKKTAAMQMASKTLLAMFRGGIYDQIGGGFHRYSTDKKWLVPHFEKMLYDNALLLKAFSEAYQVSHDKEFKRAAYEIADYLEREMRSSSTGGFYSATDADSMTPSGHREEGYFFTWKQDELLKTLGAKDADLLFKLYDVKKDGNFEGRSILFRSSKYDSFIKNNNLSSKEFELFFKRVRSKLITFRNKRHLPLRDEKLLTSWNALTISAFAVAGRVFNEKKFIDTAVSSLLFIKSKMFDGRLYRSYLKSRGKQLGFLEDYAFLIESLLDVFEANHDIVWLKWALELDKVLESEFEDKKNGGFFRVSTKHEELLVREKPAYDGAEPSGNSVHVLSLMKLYELTSKDSYRKRAYKTLKAFSRSLTRYPLSLSEMLLAVDFHYTKPVQIVIITASNKKSSAEKFISALREVFVPSSVVVVAQETKLKELSVTLPLMKGRKALKGKTTAYVCRENLCKLPTTNVKEFIAQIVGSDNK